MSNLTRPRSGTADLVRRSNDSSRPRLSQIQTSPTNLTPTSPSRVRFSEDSTAPTSPGRTGSTGGVLKNRPSRVIRTFEEIDRIVPKEEWYEELECGICSHVLGVPQGLVPCGHTFCGPCAWTWIKVNGNHTCPHCRVPVNETIPFIPNIVVDQIIDRKLDKLPDGKEKEGHVRERESKAEDWKILQVTPIPKILPPKRPGRAMGVFTNLFEPMPHHRRPNRRSTINEGETFVDMPEEELDPRRRGAYVGMTLAEATRRGMEDDPTRGGAARRLATPTGGSAGDQSLGGYATGSGAGAGAGAGRRPTLQSRTSSSTTLEQHRQRQLDRGPPSAPSAALYEVVNNTNINAGGFGIGNGIGIGGTRSRPSIQVRTYSDNRPRENDTGTSNNSNGNGVRRSITTSRALLSRQDRYRTGNGNNRDNAVLVESDSD